MSSQSQSYIDRKVESLPDQFTRKDADEELQDPSKSITACLAATAEFCHESLTDTGRAILTDEWGLSQYVINDHKLGYLNSSRELIDNLLTQFEPYTIVRAGVATSASIDHLFNCRGVSPDHAFDAPGAEPDHTCNHSVPVEVDILKLALKTERLSDSQEEGVSTLNGEGLTHTDINYRALLNHLYESNDLSLFNDWRRRITVPYYDNSGQIVNIAAVATKNSPADHNGIDDLTDRNARQVEITNGAEGLKVAPVGMALDKGTTLMFQNNTDHELTVTIECTPDDDPWSEISLPATPSNSSGSEQYVESPDIERDCDSYGYYLFTVEEKDTDKSARFGVICTDNYGPSYRYSNLEEWIADEPHYSLSLTDSSLASETGEWVDKGLKSVYGEHTLSGKGPVVITEQLQDALALDVHNIQCLAFGTTSPSFAELADMADLATSAKFAILLNNCSESGSPTERTLREATTLANEGVTVKVAEFEPADSGEYPITIRARLAADGFEDGIGRILKTAVTPQKHYQYDAKVHETTLANVRAGSIDSLSAEADDDYHVPIPNERVKNHYARIEPVMDALAEINPPSETWQSYPTMGVHDLMGWYITKHSPVEDNTVDTDLFNVKRRPIHLSEDYQTVVSGIERSLYALTSYKTYGSVKGWTPAASTGSGYDYPDDCGNPTPTFKDLRGWSVWGDIDLADELKPLRRDLPSETKETAETALRRYSEKIAERFYGGDIEAIHGLDSVGGAYLMGPPAATLPILTHFQYHEDLDEPINVLELLLDHFWEKSNEILAEIEEEVNTEVEDAEDVIQPDWANNLNRQYKSPLSIHSDHPGVVTPIDPANPHYGFTHIDDVDDALVQEATAWAESLTAYEHREYVDSIVQTIWPDEYDEADGDWRAALEKWVATKLEEQGEEHNTIDEEHQLGQNRDISGRDVKFTPDFQDLYSAVDQVSTKEIVRRFASDTGGWDTADTTVEGVIRFNPSWRTSASGRSCFVNTKENKFGDAKKGGGGYAVKAMALAEGIINCASEDLDGEDWVDAVDELRQRVSSIPYWIPGKGSQKQNRGGTYDKTPTSKVVQAALALGLCEEEDLIERESHYDDDTYEALPREVYNETIAILENEYDIDTGREMISE